MDFAQSCILAAAVLAAVSLKGFRLIALVMLANFVAHELMAVRVLEMLDGGKAWPVHALNVLISGATIYLLVFLGASKYLYSAIFIYAVYNFAILLEFIFYGVGFHGNYIAFARFQMRIELVFMLLISYIGAYAYQFFRPGDNYRDIVTSVFSVRSRMGPSGVAG